MEELSSQELTDDNVTYDQANGYRDDKGNLPHYSPGISDSRIPNMNPYSNNKQMLQGYQTPQPGPQLNRPTPKFSNVNNDSLTDEQRAMYESALSTSNPVRFKKRMKQCVCQKCSENFKKHTYLKAHMTSVHCSKESAFNCDICDKTYKNKYCLYRHRLNKHYSESEKCYCQYCLQEFRTIRGLHMHVKKIHPDNWLQPMRSCPECDKEFAFPYMVIRHLNSCHKQDKDKYKYKCLICYKLFKCLFDLNKHLRIHHQPVSKTHQPVETHPCLFCPMNFKARRQMKRHILNIHSPLKAEVTCLECFIILKNNQYLNHMQVQSSLDTTVKCDLCKKFVHSSLRLKTHKNIVHHVKPKIRCEKCNKEFTHTYNLKRHSKTIHIEVDKSNYSHECEQCGKTFKDDRYLYKHLKWHEQEHFKRIAQLVRTVMDDGDKAKTKTKRISSPRKDCEQVITVESETEEEEETEDTASESEFSGVFYGVTNLVIVVVK